MKVGLAIARVSSGMDVKDIDNTPKKKIKLMHVSKICQHLKKLANVLKQFKNRRYYNYNSSKSKEKS